jgi:hypothetical protein
MSYFRRISQTIECSPKYAEKRFHMNHPIAPHPCGSSFPSPLGMYHTVHTLWERDQGRGQVYLYIGPPEPVSNSLLVYRIPAGTSRKKTKMNVRPLRTLRTLRTVSIAVCNLLMHPILASRGIGGKKRNERQNAQNRQSRRSKGEGYGRARKSYRYCPIW